jgi:hypothetical protein
MTRNFGGEADRDAILSHASSHIPIARKMRGQC